MSKKQILAKIPNIYLNIAVLEKEKKSFMNSNLKKRIYNRRHIPTFSKYLFHALNDCFLLSPFSLEFVQWYLGIQSCDPLAMFLRSFFSAKVEKRMFWVSARQEIITQYLITSTKNRKKELKISSWKYKSISSF